MIRIENHLLSLLQYNHHVHSNKQLTSHSNSTRIRIMAALTVLLVAVSSMLLAGRPTLHIVPLCSITIYNNYYFETCNKNTRNVYV